LFYAANNVTFNDSSTPNSKYYSGASTGLWLSSISTPGTNMSAVYTYGIPGAPPPPQTQTTFFSDGFEGSGWLYWQPTGTSAYWYYTTASFYPTGIAPHGGSNMAMFNSHIANVDDQTMLYSATGIAIPASYDTIVLSFWMYHDTGYSSSPDNVQVYVSTDGDIFYYAGSTLYRYNGTTGWAQVNLDLSAYRGQPSLQIGFLGTSGHGNDIYIDDMTIGGYNVSAALRGTTNFYESLTAAYAAASVSDIIKARGVDFAEDLLCNLPKNIKLDGGYDSVFLTNPDYTILHGKVTVQGGSVIMSRVIIK
jgi:hypothetical protein